MNDVCARLRDLSRPRSGFDDGYGAWLEQADLIKFLEKNAEEEKTVVYANVPGILIFSALVPQDDVDPPDVDDLLEWNLFPKSAPESAHVAREGRSGMRIEPSLTGCGGESLSRGEQLVFDRRLKGVRERSCYVEILQKFSHVLDLHQMEERNAWCRLDHRGDIEKVVETIDFSSDDFGRGSGKKGGRAVLFDRSCLEEYAAMTGTVLVRMFDCDRGSTGGISEYETQEIRSPETGVFYRYGTASDSFASYTRGVQVVPVAISPSEVAGRFRRRYDFDDNRHREKFIVSLDFREYQKTDEVVCRSNTLLPAFFRPEVLSRYKGKRKEYSLEERSVTYTAEPPSPFPAYHEKHSFKERAGGRRNSWHLEFYDVNEAGQVYTFLRYLSFLPGEEQTYWKSFNEKPKAPVSEPYDEDGIAGKAGYSPLRNIKNRLRCLQCPWWKMRHPNVLDRAQYPIPKLKEDWKKEIIHLDQLIVEGFEEKWLRKKAKSLGRSPEPGFRSLKLVEECLIGLGFEDDHTRLIVARRRSRFPAGFRLSFEEEHARLIVAPFSELHDMRNEFEHAEGEETLNLTKKAMKDRGGYRAHYRDLAARCDESLKKLVKAFGDPATE